MSLDNVHEQMLKILEDKAYTSIQIIENLSFSEKEVLNSLKILLEQNADVEAKTNYGNYVLILIHLCIFTFCLFCIIFYSTS